MRRFVGLACLALPTSCFGCAGILPLLSPSTSKPAERGRGRRLRLERILDIGGNGLGVCLVDVE